MVSLLHNFETAFACQIAQNNRARIKFSGGVRVTDLVNSRVKIERVGPPNYCERPRIDRKLGLSVQSGYKRNM